MNRSSKEDLKAPIWLTCKEMLLTVIETFQTAIDASILTARKLD